MKNSFKLAFLGLAISLSAAACSSDKKAMGSTDSSSMDSSSTMGVGGTMKTDSSASMMDTTKKDTMKKDTMKKM